LANISQRHHYIPEFFLKGFTNSNGFLWVFDKVKNDILKTPQSPRSIFFEKKLNTISIGLEETDILEKAYSKLESVIAKKVILVREHPIIDEIEDIENFSFVIVFLTQLFWRIPSTDKYKTSLLNFYKFSKKSWEAIEKQKDIDFLSEDDKCKLIKSFIPYEILAEIESKYKKENKIFFKIIHFNPPAFLISDNPIVFKKIPYTKDDFTSALIFPISQNRLFIVLESEKYSVNNDHIKLINLILMHQAERYFACYDRNLLEKFVDGFKPFSKIDKNDLVNVSVDLINSMNK